MSRNTMKSKVPECIILFSGKRKTGKDYITERLLQRIGEDKAIIVRLSAPIKSHWAKNKNLDLAQLLNSGTYKEEHRLDMIRWSEEERAKDYGHFCRLAVEDAKNTGKSLWIVSDARRKTDLRWFREQFGFLVKTVRVYATESVRKQRGWVFTKGVDDAESECNLDDVEDWNLRVNNNGEEGEVESALQVFEMWVQQGSS